MTKQEAKKGFESSDDDDLATRKTKIKKEAKKEVKKETKKVKQEPASPAKPKGKDQKPPPKKVKPEPEPEEEVHKWWETNEQHPNGESWLTLEHNGLLFPPEYVPHGLPVHYKLDDGTMKEIPMDPEEEEVATMFGVMREQVLHNPVTLIFTLIHIAH